MGKLTLNMLLSFAQFEREVSSERVRDKIEIGEEINVFEKEGKSREFVEFCIMSIKLVKIKSNNK